MYYILLSLLYLKYNSEKKKCYFKFKNPIEFFLRSNLLNFILLSIVFISSIMSKSVNSGSTPPTDDCPNTRGLSKISKTSKISSSFIDLMKILQSFRTEFQSSVKSFTSTQTSQFNELKNDNKELFISTPRQIISLRKKFTLFGTKFI